jgi:hypothetical protein
MRNVSDKSCRANKITHFVFNTFFFENRIVYEIMYKNNVEWGRPQMTNVIRRMRIACWITKATDTHTHNVHYLLRFSSNNGFAIAMHCYAKHTWHVLFMYIGG